MRKSSRGSAVSKVLKVEGQAIPYTVEWRKVRYPRLELRTGTLKVILPRGVKDETSVLEKNLAWVLKKHEEIQKAKENLGMVLGGERGVLIFGNLYKVEPGKSLSLSLDGEGRQFDLGGEGRRRLNRFLRRVLRGELHRLVGEYSSKFGVSFGKIYIRNQKTKWASCSSLKNLSFNFKLVHLPPELIRYVVCHEVLHLMEKGHTVYFWRKLAQEFPNYEEMEKKLLEYWFFLSELKEG